MMRSTGQILSLLLLLLGFGSAWPAFSQEPNEASEIEASEEEGAYVETVDVTVVNLDVYVTDKMGVPITGLTRDDFEIFENGRPVAITNFFAVEDRRPVEDQPVTASSEPQAPAVPGLPEEEKFALPDDQRLSLVIYVDNFNIRPFNRNRVFRRLRDFLVEKVSIHDQVMLVTYDRSLHMRHEFTSDPTLIASQLFELEELAAFGVHWDSERRDVLRDINDSDSLAAISWRVRQFAESGDNDLSFSFGAIKEIVTSLAETHGYRKAGLSDEELESLATFVRTGLVDTAKWIDEAGAFKGDPGRGPKLYVQGLGGKKSCAACHGPDGLQAPLLSNPDYEDFVGKVAKKNPWEFLHKVRFGQPGTKMPAAVNGTATMQDIVDLGAYAQRLPTSK